MGDILDLNEKIVELQQIVVDLNERIEEVENVVFEPEDENEDEAVVKESSKITKKVRD